MNKRLRNIAGTSVGLLHVLVEIPMVHKSCSALVFLANQLWCPMSSVEMIFKTLPVCELLTTALFQTTKGPFLEVHSLGVPR